MDAGAPRCMRQRRLGDEADHAVDDTVTTTGIRTIAQCGGLLLLNGQPPCSMAPDHGLTAGPGPDGAAKYNRCAPALA